jgi:hypothetical protein
MRFVQIYCRWTVPFKRSVLCEMRRVGKLAVFGPYSDTMAIEVYLPFEQNTPFLCTDKEVPFRLSKLILECDVFNNRQCTSNCSLCSSFYIPFVCSVRNYRGLANTTGKPERPESWNDRKAGTTQESRTMGMIAASIY